MVTLVRGGKVQYREVYDPLLYRAFMQLSRKKIPYISALRAPRHLLTMMVGLDPNFQAGNFVRDTFHVSVITHKGFIPVLDSLKGAIDVAKSMTMGGGAFAEFRAAGGGMSAFFEAQRPTTHTEIEHRFGGAGRARKAIWNVSDAVAWIEKYESTIEYGTRVGMFMKLRKRGVPLLDAVYQARQASTDFSMRGSNPFIRFFIDTVPFLNARMQGLYRTGRGAKENPKRFIFKAGIVAAASIGLMLYYRDDERYKRLTDYEKDLYWNAWIGGQHVQRLKPFEGGARFGTIPERIVPHGGRVYEKDFLDRMSWVVREMFNFDPTPQFIAPPLRVYSNWDDFRDRPVVPQWLTGVKPEAQFTERTPTTLTELGRVTGLSPLKMEAIITGYLANIGVYVLGASDVMLHKIGDYPTKPAMRVVDWPGVRRFLGPDVPYSTSYSQQFYKMRKDISEVYNTYKRFQTIGDLPRTRDYIAENRIKIGLRDPVENIAKQAREINQAMRMIRMRRNMAPEAKAEALDRYKLMKYRLFKMSDRLKPIYERAR